MAKKLMIIDSEAFDRDIARKIFSGKYEMAFAENLSEFQSSIDAIKPEVVLYELRTSNECELRDAIVATKLRGTPLPLVLVISENSVELEATARDYGVFYCLIRPFNLKELWDVLEAAFTYARQSIARTSLREFRLK